MAVSVFRHARALELLRVPGAQQILGRDPTAQSPCGRCRAKHSKSQQEAKSLVVAASPPMAQPRAAEAVLSQLRHHWTDWQQRSGSDIDIWVELEPLIPYALVHLKQELKALLPAPVDVVHLRQRMNPALRQRIELEGLAA